MSTSPRGADQKRRNVTSAPSQRRVQSARAPNGDGDREATRGAKAESAWPQDWLIGLMIYRHGLRVSEACDLRWDDIDLAARTITIRRLKGSRDSTHYLERDELAGLRRLARNGAYVFVNERGDPFKREGIARMIQRAGEAAGSASQSMRICSATPAVMPWRKREWIPEGFSITSGMRA